MEFTTVKMKKKKEKKTNNNKNNHDRNDLSICRYSMKDTTGHEEVNK